MNNNQISLEELELWFADVWNIIVDIHISINNMERIRIENYDFEEKVKKHGFFQHHWYQLKFIAVIQLYKLIKESEERSFAKICNKLVNNKYTPDLKKHLKDIANKSTIVCKGRKELKVFSGDLKKSLEQKADLIARVIDIRNNIYAHQGSNDNVKAVTLDDLKELRDFLTEAYNNLWLRTFFQEAYIAASDWSIDYVLFHCANSFKSDEQDRIRKKSAFNSES